MDLFSKWPVTRKRLVENRKGLKLRTGSTVAENMGTSAHVVARINIGAMKHLSIIVSHMTIISTVVAKQLRKKSPIRHYKANSDHMGTFVMFINICSC